jgi:hypothetical protein
LKSCRSLYGTPFEPKSIEKLPKKLPKKFPKSIRKVPQQYPMKKSTKNSMNSVSENWCLQYQNPGIINPELQSRGISRTISGTISGSISALSLALSIRHSNFISKIANDYIQTYQILPTKGMKKRKHGVSNFYSTNGRRCYAQVIFTCYL